MKKPEALIIKSKLLYTCSTRLQGSSLDNDVLSFTFRGGNVTTIVTYIQLVLACLLRQCQYILSIARELRQANSMELS
jgi:hypothetical protein